MNMDMNMVAHHALTHLFPSLALIYLSRSESCGMNGLGCPLGLAVDAIIGWTGITGDWGTGAGGAAGGACARGASTGSIRSSSMGTGGCAP